MEKEIWKPIDGYPNYCVSNFGNVKSLNYRRTGKEGILKPHTDKKGYLYVVLCKDKKQKTVKVHRILAETFIKNQHNLPQVNHKDEDKTNNFAYINEDGTVDLEKSNLEWCDAIYNINYGTRNERAAKKISESLKGIKPSEKTRKKLSEAHKGKKHSEEAKRKISEGNKGKHSKKTVLQINKITNEVIKEWESTQEVQEKLGLYKSNISKCCLKKPHYNTAYGYKWRFK